MLRDALALAGLDTPPADAATTRDFLGGPLFLALTAVIGADAAKTVCERVRDALHLSVDVDEEPVPDQTGVRSGALRRERQTDPAPPKEPAARATIRPVSVSMRHVVVVGSDVLRSALAARLADPHIRVTQPGLVRDPDVVVVEGADAQSKTRPKAIELARACTARWPKARVLLCCDAVDPGTAPAGVFVVPLGANFVVELAAVIRAHLDARGLDGQ